MNGAIPKHYPSSKSTERLFPPLVTLSESSSGYRHLLPIHIYRPPKVDTEENSCEVLSPSWLEGPSSIATSNSYSAGVKRPDLRPPGERTAGCREGPSFRLLTLPLSTVALLWLSPLPPRYSVRVGSAPQFRGQCWACDKHFINIHPLRDVEQPGTQTSLCKGSWLSVIGTEHQLPTPRAWVA